MFPENRDFNSMGLETDCVFLRHVVVEENILRHSMTVSTVSGRKPFLSTPDHTMNMKTDKVLTRNRIVAFVAVIAVAACLLFAYLTQDDTDVGPRTSEEVGDYVDIGVWDTDGNYTDSRLVLIEVEDGEHTYAYIIDGVFRQSFTVDMDLIVLTCLPPEGESAGTGLVETPGGFYECDAVETEKGTFYVCDGLNVKMELKDRTVVIYGTSLTENEAPVCGNLRQNVRVGDYVATSETIDDITMVTITSVREIDGTMLKIDLVTYTIGPDSTTVDRDSYVTEIDSFLSTLVADQSFLADGWTTDNRVVCLPMAMGSVPAVEYVKDGSAVWVGAADNAFLRFESEDVGITLIGTSLLSDASPVYDRSPASDLEDGERMVYNMIWFRICEYGLDDIHTESLMADVEECHGDSMDVAVTILPRLEQNRVTVDKEYIEPRMDSYNIRDIIRVEVVDTPMGPKLCAVTHKVGGQAVTEETFDVFSNIMYTMKKTVNDYIKIFTLSQYDGVVSTRDPSIPMNGDMTYYLQEDDQQNQKIVTMCMFELHGLHFVMVNDNEESDWGVIVESDTGDRKEIVDTWFGELECYVSVYDYGNGNVQTSWTPVGWAYPAKYGYDTPYGSWTMMLVYTSSQPYY